MKKIHKSILCIFLSLVICAFSMQMGLLRAVGLQPSGVVVLQNVPYDVQSYAKMDIYLPDNIENIQEPVFCVLFLHGGYWISGDKSSYSNSALEVALAGGIAVSMNYPLTNPDNSITYLDMLEGIDTAINELCDFAYDNGIEISSMALMGYSSGAHLSLLYSYTRCEDPIIPIAFCIGQAGPTDFLDLNYLTSELGNPVGTWLLSMLIGVEIRFEDYAEATLPPETVEAIMDAMPLYHAREGVPPTILCHGALDNTAPLSNGLSLQAKLEEEGVPHDFILYPNADHSLSDDPEMDLLFRQTALQYIQEYMGFLLDV